MSRHHARLPSRRWGRVRRRVLDDAGWRCALCGRYGSEVDHVVPLRLGGDPWDDGNLQAICNQCHIAKSAAENGKAFSPEKAAWKKVLRAIGREG